MSQYRIDENDFIGDGGFGSVYGIKDNFDLAAKKSIREDFRSLYVEYKKSEEISSSLCSNEDYNSLVLASFLSPIGFQHSNKENEQCFTIMPRIFPPSSDDSDLKKLFYGRPGMTVQTVFGRKDSDAKVSADSKTRGNIVGKESVRKYWETIYGPKESHLNKAYYELGKLLALIHFVARYDGYDLEVYLGHKRGDEGLKFYIADFDQFEKVTEFSKEALDRMSFSIGAVAYFPSPNDDEEKICYEEFRRGYMEIGQKQGVGETAKYILDEGFDWY